MSNAVTDEMVEAACAATVLGTDEHGYSVHLSREEALTALSAALSVCAEPVAHTDDLAVDRFAAAMVKGFSAEMKAKLTKKREQGVTGWDDPEVCHIDYLVSLLMQQIHERAVLDPIDIANIAMMIHERGETPSHGR